MANARTTEHVKKRVIEQVQGSGLFSAASDAPALDGAVLAVVVNNVVLDDEAYKKGFITGLTFGLAGNTVTDGDVCTIRYSGPGGAAPIVKEARCMR